MIDQRSSERPVDVADKIIEKLRLPPAPAVTGVRLSASIESILNCGVCTAT